MEGSAFSRSMSDMSSLCVVSSESLKSWDGMPHSSQSRNLARTYVAEPWSSPTSTTGALVVADQHNRQTTRDIPRHQSRSALGSATANLGSEFLTVDNRSHTGP